VTQPARYDITIHQGATFVLPLQYRDNTGLPIDMTGYGVNATLWNNVGTVKLANFDTPWTVQASFTFSAGDITDWTNVRLRFTQTNSGGGGNARGSAVSWAEIEAPAAAAVLTRYVLVT
jgi:hypothetical protein